MTMHDDSSSNNESVTYFYIHSIFYNHLSSHIWDSGVRALRGSSQGDSNRLISAHFQGLIPHLPPGPSRAAPSLHHPRSLQHHHLPRVGHLCSGALRRPRGSAWHHSGSRRRLSLRALLPLGCHIPVPGAWASPHARGDQHEVKKRMGRSLSLVEGE